MVQRIALLTVAVIAAADAGCTANALRWNSVQQGGTIMDTYYRQVLDNIARLAAVPGALPQFAVAGSGTTQITDSAGVETLNLAWISRNSSAGLLGRRDVVESWALSPVIEPDRLIAMRHAFDAVMEPGFGYVRAAKIQGNEVTSTGSRISSLNDVLKHPLPTGWFDVGRWYHVPPGAPFGRYGRTYAWVLPGRMPDMSKFTVRLLEIATIGKKKERAEFIYTTDGETRVRQMEVPEGPDYEVPRGGPFPQFYPTR